MIEKKTSGERTRWRWLRRLYVLRTVVHLKRTVGSIILGASCYQRQLERSCYGAGVVVRVCGATKLHALIT
jgi:hypothetical protein